MEEDQGEGTAEEEEDEEGTTTLYITYQDTQQFSEFDVGVKVSTVIKQACEEFGVKAPRDCVRLRK